MESKEGTSRKRKSPHVVSDFLTWPSGTILGGVNEETEMTDSSSSSSSSSHHPPHAPERKHKEEKKKSRESQEEEENNNNNKNKRPRVEFAHRDPSHGMSAIRRAIVYDDLESFRTCLLDQPEVCHALEQYESYKRQLHPYNFALRSLHHLFAGQLYLIDTLFEAIMANCVNIVTFLCSGEYSGLMFHRHFNFEGMYAYPGVTEKKCHPYDSKDTEADLRTRGANSNDSLFAKFTRIAEAAVATAFAYMYIRKKSCTMLLLQNPNREDADLLNLDIVLFSTALETLPQDRLYAPAPVYWETFDSMLCTHFEAALTMCMLNLRVVTANTKDPEHTLFDEAAAMFGTDLRLLKENGAFTEMKFRDIRAILRLHRRQKLTLPGIRLSTTHFETLSEYKEQDISDFCEFMAAFGSKQQQCIHTNLIKCPILAHVSPEQFNAIFCRDDAIEKAFVFATNGGEVATWDAIVDELVQTYASLPAYRERLLGLAWYCENAPGCCGAFSILIASGALDSSIVDSEAVVALVASHTDEDEHILLVPAAYTCISNMTDVSTPVKTALRELLSGTNAVFLRTALGVDEGVSEMYGASLAHVFIKCGITKYKCVLDTLVDLEQHTLLRNLAQRCEFARAYCASIKKAHTPIASQTM